MFTDTTKLALADNPHFNESAPRPICSISGDVVLLNFKVVLVNTTVVLANIKVVIVNTTIVLVNITIGLVNVQVVLVNNF